MAGKSQPYSWMLRVFGRMKMKTVIQMQKLDKQASGNPLFRIFLETPESWMGWGTLLFLSFLSGWLSTKAAGLTGEMIDQGLALHFSAMKGTGVFLATVLVLSGFRTFLHNYVNARTTEKMFLKIRRRMFSALTCGELERIEGRMQTGEVVSRLNHDVERLCEMIAGSFTWYMRVILEAVVTLAVCLRLSWQLTAVYLVLIPVSILVMDRLSRKMKDLQKKASAYTGNMVSVVSEALDKTAMVRAYGIEDVVQERFAKEAEAAKAWELEIQKRDAMITAVRYGFQILQLGCLFGVSAWQVVRGSLSAGSAVAFITVCGNIRTAMELFGRMAVSYHTALGLAERVYEVLDIPMEEDEKGEFHFGSGDSIVFEKVCFSYDSGREVLKDIDMRIRSGEKVGIIGSSGCGKSTLIRLLCRFNSITSGTLSLAGKRIEELSGAALYPQLALVGQQPFLFSGTIRENVLKGRVDASDDEIEEVLKRVQLWEYVLALPKGMDTEIGESGGKLSGGQAQRLSIARALVKDAQIVLLDEPTAALDQKTEASLKDAFAELLKGRTAVIVTHRYEILEDVDYIYRLDGGGKIAWQGSCGNFFAREAGYDFRLLAPQGQERGR